MKYVLPTFAIAFILFILYLAILSVSASTHRNTGPIGQYDKEYAVYEDCLKDYGSPAFCGGIVTRIKE